MAAAGWRWPPPSGSPVPSCSASSPDRHDGRCRPWFGLLAWSGSAAPSHWGGSPVDGLISSMLVVWAVERLDHVASCPAPPLDRAAGFLSSWSFDRSARVLGTGYGVREPASSAICGCWQRGTRTPNLLLTGQRAIAHGVLVGAVLAPMGSGRVKGVRGSARQRALGWLACGVGRGAESEGEKARTTSRSWLACTHSGPGGGVRMTVESGPGLLSQLNGRVPGSCKDASAPGTGLLRCLVGLQLRQDVEAAGNSRRATATVAMLRPRRRASWP